MVRVPENETVERLAHYYAQQIIDQKLVDVSSSKPGKKREDLVETSDYQLVDVNSLSHERAREIRAEWLCQQAVEQ